MLCMLGDALERLTALGVPAHRVILIGGGSASSAVQQAAADLFDAPVVIPRPAEYVALGAARQAAWALSGRRAATRLARGDVGHPRATGQRLGGRGAGPVRRRPPAPLRRVTGRRPATCCGGVSRVGSDCGTDLTHRPGANRPSRTAIRRVSAPPEAAPREGGPPLATRSAGSSATCSRHHDETSRPASTDSRNSGQGSQRCSSISAGSARTSSAERGHEHRAHLVLDDAVVHLGAVAEPWQHQPEVTQRQPELLPDPAHDGLLERPRQARGARSTSWSTRRERSPWPAHVG